MKFKLPLQVHIQRKKTFKKIRINKNIERNLHYSVYSEIKKKFTLLMKPQCTERVVEYPIRATYKVYFDSKRKIDLDNLSLVVKFSLDGLQKWGVIEGDDTKYIQEVVIKWCGVDLEDPRVELELTKLTN